MAATAALVLLVPVAVLQGAFGPLVGVAEAQAQGNLVVNRQDLDGANRNMWVTIKPADGGKSLMASWQTPYEFAGAAGTTYSVKAHNWSEGGLFFDHWEDGSTIATRRVTLAEGTTTLTAYYRTEASPQAEAAAAPAAVAQPAPVAAPAPVAPAPAPAPQNEGKDSTGVYVPLYKYPDLGDASGLWSSVIKAKKAHPSVPFAVSVNPSNGPGWSDDSRISSAIGELKAAGVEHVLGYMPTMYATEPSGRTMGDLKGMVDRYRAWYPEMDGLMMDTMAAGSDKVSFYKELVQYAKSKGFTFIKGNPGAKVDSAYVGIFDNISIYERYDAPSISTLASNTLQHLSFGKEKFSFTAKGVPGLDLGYLNEIKGYVSFVYMTNDGGSNPYNSVPPYFDSMVDGLDD
ncbi:MAG: spherulation-specific family 4 protein [Nitrososphaera sp.]|uniref:spherulation-specific family 4 protein n=1 Tax=Nitrososphaera sp. TaxID=1971748 RepID=UPI003D6FD10D